MAKWYQYPAAVPVQQIQTRKPNLYKETCFKNALPFFKVQVYCSLVHLQSQFHGSVYKHVLAKQSAPEAESKGKAYFLHSKATQSNQQQNHLCQSGSPRSRGQDGMRCARNVLYISTRLASRGTGCFCVGLSVHACLHSEYPWGMKIISPSKAAQERFFTVQDNKNNTFLQGKDQAGLMLIKKDSGSQAWGASPIKRKTTLAPLLHVGASPGPFGAQTSIANADTLAAGIVSKNIFL